MSISAESANRPGWLPKKPWQVTMCVSFLFGVLAHLFALTNPIHNYDDIVAQPLGYGTGIFSGRWFLQLVGDAALHNNFCYNLTALNGLMLLLLVALSAGLLVSALKIRNNTAACLVGILFVVFPTAASILFFRFTAPYYGLSILLAVLAAWVLRRFPGSLIVSGLCTALSLGIYQSGTPLTISILVLMLIQDSLSGEYSWKDVVLRGLYDCLALILGLVFYYIALQKMLTQWGVELNHYQGIESMGQISLTQLPSLIREAFLTPICLSSENYCGLASNVPVRRLYLLLEIASGVLLIWVWLVRRPKVLNLLASLVLLLLFPIAVDFIAIMCPDAGVYTLMVYSFATIFCLPVLLWELLPVGEGLQKRLCGLAKTAVVALLCCFVFAYTYEDNVNYNALYYANRQTENHYVSLAAQVRMTEGFTSGSKWAFVGEFEDPLMPSPAWNRVSTYGGNCSHTSLLSSYCRPFWLNTYLGYSVSFASEEEVASLSQTAAVRQMPCWPDNGSIQVIGDTVIIKYRDISPE